MILIVTFTLFNIHVLIFVKIFEVVKQLFPYANEKEMIVSLERAVYFIFIFLFFTFGFI